jgi:hypothetical protein
MRLVCAVICAMLCFGVMANNVHAQCRGRCFTYTTYPTTYQYPVREVVVREVITPVAVPIAVPVLIPAFQYQYIAPVAAPVQPVQSVVQQTYPGSPGLGYPGVPMQPMAYGPGGQQAAPSQLGEQERIRLLAKALLAEMSKQADGDQGPPMALDKDQSMSLLFAEGIMSNKCARCHTGTTAKAGVQLFISPGVFNAAIDKQRVLRAIEEGRMPPPDVAPQFRLNQQEIAAIRSRLQ